MTRTVFTAAAALSLLAVPVGAQPADTALLRCEVDEPGFGVIGQDLRIEPQGWSSRVDGGEWSVMPCGVATVICETTDTVFRYAVTVQSQVYSNLTIDRRTGAYRSVVGGEEPVTGACRQVSE